MQVSVSHPPVATSPHQGEEHKTAHLLYQSATVLAIALFLISFW